MNLGKPVLSSLKSNRASSLWSGCMLSVYGLLGDLSILMKSRGCRRKVMFFEFPYLLSTFVALGAFSAQSIVQRRVRWARFSTVVACLASCARTGTISIARVSVYAAAEDAVELSVKVTEEPVSTAETRCSDRYLPSS